MKILFFITCDVEISGKSEAVGRAAFHANAALAARRIIEGIGCGGLPLFALPLFPLDIRDGSRRTVLRADAAGDTTVFPRIFSVGQEFGMTAEPRADIQQLARILARYHRLKHSPDGNPQAGQQRTRTPDECRR